MPKRKTAPEPEAPKRKSKTRLDEIDQAELDAWWAATVAQSKTNRRHQWTGAARPKR